MPCKGNVYINEDRDVNLVLSAALKLKKFDVHKVYDAEECLKKLNELQAKSRCYFYRWQNSSR